MRLERRKSRDRRDAELEEEKALLRGGDKTKVPDRKGRFIDVQA